MTQFEIHTLQVEIIWLSSQLAHNTTIFFLKYGLPFVDMVYEINALTFVELIQAANLSQTKGYSSLTMTSPDGFFQLSSIL